MYKHGPNNTLPHSYLTKHQSLPQSFVPVTLGLCQFLEFAKLFPTRGSLLFAKKPFLHVFDAGFLFYILC
jgi:hypothetical protein